MKSIYKLKSFNVELQVSEPATKSARSSKEVAHILRAIYARLDVDQEHFALLCLDQKSNLRGYKVVFTGSQTAVTWHPSPIFRAAILFGATRIIVCHNHPSGDPAPGAEDFETNRRLEQCCELMGIELLDNLILGRDSLFSFRRSRQIDREVAASRGRFTAKRALRERLEREAENESRFAF